MKSKPNVIVVICDQLRAFEVGCYGNDVIRTPHLDRLANEGVRFDFAVTNNPVCMAARSSLMSGQYSRTCTGQLDNDAVEDEKGWIAPEYPEENRDTHLPDPTLPERFKALGYETALIGKWHIRPAPRLVGFDYSLFPLVGHRHTGQKFIENKGMAKLVDGFSVEYEIENVERYLSERRCRRSSVKATNDKPFFLYYSISPPHMPIADMPEKYLKMYSPNEVLIRPNVYVDGKLPYNEEWFKVYLWDFLYYHDKLPYTLELPEGFDIKKMTALYYGATTWLDDMIGRMMAAIEANALRENTIVVFMADHGDNLGSHHLFNKGRLIDESIRIPMIFWAPEMWSSRVNTVQVAQTLDVMPTLLDVCGGDSHPAVQGRSLAPVLMGEREALEDDSAFIETTCGEIGIRTTTHLYGMNMTDDGKTIAEPEYCFYDLRKDPYEQNNLAGTATQKDMADVLRQRLAKWHNSTCWLGARGLGFGISIFGFGCGGFNRKSKIKNRVVEK